MSCFSWEVMNNPILSLNEREKALYFKCVEKFGDVAKGVFSFPFAWEGTIPEKLQIEHWDEVLAIVENNTDWNEVVRLGDELGAKVYHETDDHMWL